MNTLLDVDPLHTGALAAMGDMEAANKAWASALGWYEKASNAKPAEMGLKLLVGSHILTHVKQIGGGYLT